MATSSVQKSRGQAAPPRPLPRTLSRVRLARVSRPINLVLSTYADQEASWSVPTELRFIQKWHVLSAHRLSGPIGLDEDDEGNRPLGLAAPPAVRTASGSRRQARRASQDMDFPQGTFMVEEPAPFRLAAKGWLKPGSERQTLWRLG